MIKSSLIFLFLSGVILQAPDFTYQPPEIIQRLMPLSVSGNRRASAFIDIQDRQVDQEAVKLLAHYRDELLPKILHTLKIPYFKISITKPQLPICSFIFRGEYFVYATRNDFPPHVMQRLWKRQKFHYDNVPIAMLTLFAVQTTEGWPM